MEIAGSCAAVPTSKMVHIQTLMLRRGTDTKGLITHGLALA